MRKGLLAVACVVAIVLFMQVSEELIKTMTNFYDSSVSIGSVGQNEGTNNSQVSTEDLNAGLYKLIFNDGSNGFISIVNRTLSEQNSTVVEQNLSAAEQLDVIANVILEASNDINLSLAKQPPSIEIDNVTVQASNDITVPVTEQSLSTAEQPGDVTAVVSEASNDITVPTTTTASSVAEEDCQTAIKFPRTLIDASALRFHHGEGHTWEVSYQGCMLRMNASQASECLAKKSPRGVLMMGDSLTRYQYLNLVYFLETGLKLSPADMPNENEHRHPSWKEFYRVTNERMGGHEMCDCQRGEPYNGHPLENRYYFNPDTGARVTYVQLGLPVGHPLRRHEFNPSTGKLDCLPGYCSPLDSETPKLIHYSNFADAMTRVTEELAPSDAFYNGGLHIYRYGEGFPTPANAAYLTAAATKQVHGSRMHWKTTTHYSTINMEAVKEEYDFAKTLMAGGFAGTFDTWTITKGLMDEAARLGIPEDQIMWDACHFQPQVYVAINQVFLMYLCRDEGSTTS